MSRPSVLCLGVGNAYRRDDGIGPAVVRALAKRAPPGVACAVEPGEVARLIDAWEGYDALVLVDALAMAGPAGTLVHVDPLRDSMPVAAEDPSSHGLGVVEALRLSEALGTLPRHVDLLCINGVDFGHGDTLSAALASRLDSYVEAAALLCGQTVTEVEGADA